MLSAKQEQFVQNIISGMSLADAYRSAYSTEKMSNKTVHEAASRLAKDGKIIARIEEIREQIADANIMSAKERLVWLSKLIKSEEETTADKLRASDQMNKMQGEYTTKIVGDIKGSVKLEDLL